MTNWSANNNGSQTLLDGTQRAGGVEKVEPADFDFRTAATRRNEELCEEVNNNMKDVLTDGGDAVSIGLDVLEATIGGKTKDLSKVITSGYTIYDASQLTKNGINKTIDFTTDLAITGSGMLDPKASLILSGVKKSYEGIGAIFKSYYDVGQNALDDAINDMIADIERNK